MQGESPGLRVPCSPPPADVNECEAGVHRCGEGQVCHNLPGSYRCDCKPGFQRDAFGRACVGRWDWWPGPRPAALRGARLPQALPPASLALTTWPALSGLDSLPAVLSSCGSALGPHRALFLPFAVPSVSPCLPLVSVQHLLCRLPLLPLPPRSFWAPGSLSSPGLEAAGVQAPSALPEALHLPPAPQT